MTDKLDFAMQTRLRIYIYVRSKCHPCTYTLSHTRTCDWVEKRLNSGGNYLNLASLMLLIANNQAVI